MTSNTLRHALLTFTVSTLSLYCASATATTYTYTLFSVTGAKQTNPAGIAKNGTVFGNWVDANYVVHGFTYAAGKLKIIDPPHTTTTYVTGVSALGDVAGTYLHNGTSSGFIYTAKGLQTIDLPGSNFTSINAINATDEAVGVGTGSGGTQIIYTYQAGKFTRYAVGMSPIAVGINDAGEIAGYNEPAGAYETGFVIDQGKYVVIPTQNVVFTQSYGINNNGEVAGQIANPSRQEFGFTYRAGKVHTVTYPGSTDSFSIGLNDHGAVVGASYNNDGSIVGYLASKGQFTTLTVSGAQETHALGINDSGLVVGDYVDSTGTHGFLATPAK